MNELIKLLVGQGLLFPLQAILIAVNCYVFSKDKFNIFLIYSLLLIFSTLVLQLVRRRFLLLYPFNSESGRESSHIDTYYLRAIVIISSVLLVVGLTSPTTHFSEIKESLFFSLIPVMALLLLGLIPCAFWLFSKELNKMIANKLKKDGPRTFVSQCNYCGLNSCIQENLIITENKIKISRKCNACLKEEPSYEVFTNIGE